MDFDTKKFALIEPLITCLAIYSSSLIASERDCTPNVNNKDYIVGFGEGNTFADAKNKAIVDVISFFGQKIKATSELSETDTNHSDSTSLSTKIQTRIESVVKGAELLSTCKNSLGFHVTVGLNKGIVARQIETNNEDKLRWFDKTLNMLAKEPAETQESKIGESKASYSKFMEQEKTDREIWNLLGNQNSEFKAISEKLKNELNALLEKYSKSTFPSLITSEGSLSISTLPTLINKLSSLGYNVRVAPNDVRSQTSSKWGCEINKGILVGNFMRFSAQCQLIGSEVKINAVTVSGISEPINIESIAQRLLIQAINEIEVSLSH